MTDESLRSYAKRKIPKKFAQNIVYRLSKENFIDSVNSRPEDARELLADDFKSYDSELDSDNIAEWLADLFVEIIREAAGLVKQGDLEKQKQQQLAQEKKLLENNMNSKNIIDALPLEKGITGGLTKVKNLKQTDFENVSLEPKEIKQKISPAEDFALYTQVNLFVSTYFIRIREIMRNLDK